jgi:hypothetical protein
MKNRPNWKRTFYLGMTLIITSGAAYAQVPDTVWTDALKVYGPLCLGWVGFAYVGKFILDRYDKDIQAKSDLASVMTKLEARLAAMEAK